MIIAGERKFLWNVKPLSHAPRDRSGLRHPASTSCWKQHLCLAGRGPNSNALYPPLAAVVTVAPNSGALGIKGNSQGST